MTGETLDEQPMALRAVFVVGVLLLIPAIALGLLSLTRILGDDDPSTVAAAVTPSPTTSAATLTPTSPSPSPSRPPSPSADPSPEPSPSAAPSASPAAIAPLVPYDGTPPTTEAEVRAVYDVMVEAAGSIGEAPDPAKVPALYAPECVCYQPFIDSVTGLRDRGEYTQGGVPEVLEFQLRYARTDPLVGWSVEVLRQVDRGGKTYNSEGAIVADASDVGPERLIVSTIARDGAWYFTQVDRVRQP